MSDYLYLRGIAIGFAIAAPIGPVGLLCIRKALADGRIAAFVAGLGAAMADTFFGAVVGLGLGVVSEFIHGHTHVLKIVGGLFMLGLGLHTWRAAAASLEAPPEGVRGPGMARDFLSTFVITISNPGTILGVVGVFAALGASAQATTVATQLQLVAGIFTGSALWWAVLTEMTIAIRARFTPKRMRLFNHISGALLMGLGGLTLASLLF
ncbi:LysE family translocator [Magnetospirillum gryphiswaldense]|uniref:Lysine exporter protein (LYSE/YGGA) n=1 Tax=Magnetospirillum gryphiswaldense TaxID=55518 RepID=A4TU90_9PROT|nr:LysE family transporter [Magnetospirillum gryphiswaldense]AVM74705.1 homoserine/homoserine lactone efflux protein [Magnetospirillum gryphiswaldense MSR-1]AVM78608.1 homoserine/homoserine lactone efflux protein [Magnetospirillum gryphiswaldense]CAM74197.1 Lysine exporter protein (LYSE/YGGA) [Magnetospirillum gryphiswaldense MSR-1]